jgi:hypothetical protein
VLSLGEHLVEEAFGLVLGALLGKGDLADEDVTGLGEKSTKDEAEGLLDKVLTEA